MKIEEYACIWAAHIVNTLHDLARTESDLGKRYREFHDYSYGYVLRQSDELEADLLVRGPDRGQDGCVEDIAVIERRFRY